MTKRLIWAAILLAITIALYFLTRPSPPVVGESVPVPSTSQQPSEAPAGQMSASPPQEGSAPQSAGRSLPEEPRMVEPSTPSALPPAEQNAGAAAPQPVEEVTGPDEELENVQFMVRGYRDALGENPVGNNAEITKALTGDNARQVKLPLPVGSHLNDAGELTDRWGTPYFFHQLSAKEMEIRSAGPDQQMWTRDDLLTR